jgi:hypothetical protein
MIPWAERLTPLDGVLLAIDAGLLVLAVVSSLLSIVIVVSRVRGTGASSTANGIGVFAALELAALVVSVPLFFKAASDQLSMFGAESMLPMMVAPALRLATPLLFAVLVANVVAVSIAMKLPRASSSASTQRGSDA